MLTEAVAAWRRRLYAADAAAAAAKHLQRYDSVRAAAVAAPGLGLEAKLRVRPRKTLTNGYAGELPLVGGPAVLWPISTIFNLLLLCYSSWDSNFKLGFNSSDFRLNSCT